LGPTGGVWCLQAQSGALLILLKAALRVFALFHFGFVLRFTWMGTLPTLLLLFTAALLLQIALLTALFLTARLLVLVVGPAALLLLLALLLVFHVIHLQWYNTVGAADRRSIPNE
jgi:hypothetical protein